MGFNISVQFKNLGGFPALSNPGLPISGVDHTYDDGYNLVDISDNAGNLTSNWGYENDSQHVTANGRNDIVMNSSSSAATASSIAATAATMSPT